MAIYTVLAPPAGPDPAGPDPDGFLFIKEGFSWPALFVAPIWFLWHRMWLVLLLYLAASIGLGLFTERLPVVGWAIAFLFAFLVALEANNLRRWTLERRGHRTVAVASGDNRSDAELRFFSNWTAKVGAKQESKTSGETPEPPGPPDAPGRAEGNEVVGLFPKPRGLS